MDNVKHISTGSQALRKGCEPDNAELPLSHVRGAVRGEASILATLIDQDRPLDPVRLFKLAALASELGSRLERRVKPRDPDERKRSDAHSDQILAMLIAAGHTGCTNAQLWTVCHAVNSRVSDLRRCGNVIEAKSEGGGVFRYRLVSTAPRPSAFQQRRRKEHDREMPLFAGAA